MKYQKMRIFSYKNSDSVEAEYEKRYNNYAAIHTGLEICPFINEKRKTDKRYELFYIPLHKLLMLEERIKYNSEELLQLKKKLPPIVVAKITESAIIEEIQSTNETEGVRSTRHEIGEAINNKGNKFPKRFQGITNMYLKLNSKEFFFIDSEEKIREIYDSLLKGEISEEDYPDGQYFRKDQVDIQGANKIIHTGNPNEESIISDMKKLIVFMNNKKIPFLSKCFITHYFLEYIHPFYDGNGRLGRFIISSYLSRKLDVYTGLSFSNAVNANKKSYYESFVEVSHPKNFGEITFFIETMLDLTIEGQKKMIAELQEAQAKMAFLKSYMKSFKEELSSSAINTLFQYCQVYLFAQYEAGLTDIEWSRAFETSRYMMDKDYEELVKKGYMVKMGIKPSKHILSDEVINKIS